MESFQPIIFSYRLVIKCHPSRTQSTQGRTNNNYYPILQTQTANIKKLLKGLVSLPLLPVQS